MVIGRRSLLLAGAALPVAARAQCVTDTQAVDACRGGVRITQPPGATLDLSFMNPGTMPPGITLTRASTATYFNAAGTMQTSASNAPRWDYDPATHALGGLLIEEARTNLWLQSADASNAAWGSSPPTRVANQTAAPDGTTTAASVAYPAVSGGLFYALAQSITATANPYALSVWLKGAVGGERLYLMATANAVNYYRLQATLTTSWQRFSLVTPALTAATWYFQIGVDLRDAGQTGTPAQTVYAWGGQLEAGAFQTSYIPVTAAAVTRAAEQCYAAIGAWYNAPAYSLMAEFDTANVGSVYAGISDGTFANSAYLGNSGFVAPNSVVGSPLLLTGVVNKTCGTFTAATQIKVCNTGGAVAATAISGAALTGVTRLSIGMSPWGLDNALNGHMRRIRVWPRVLTDTELQSVTR